MRIREFVHGPAKQLGDMTAEDVFFGFDGELWVRVFDSPNPEAIMRLKDNHFGAVALSDVFDTTLAIVEPL